MAKNKPRLRPIKTVVESAKVVVRLRHVAVPAALLPFIAFALFLAYIPYSVLLDLGYPDENDPVVRGLIVILALFIVPYMVVPLHRAVILKERRTQRSQVGRHHLRYAGALAVLLGLDYSLQYIGTHAAASTLHSGAELAIMFVIIGVLYVVFAILIFAYLPALAVGEQKVHPFRIWRALKGNRFRYFLLILFNPFPYMLTYYILSEIYTSGILFHLLPEDLTDFGPLLRPTTEGILLFTATLFFSSLQAFVIIFAFCTQAVGLSLVYAGLRHRLRLA